MDEAREILKTCSKSDMKKHNKENRVKSHWVLELVDCPLYGVGVKLLLQAQLLARLARLFA